MADFHEEMDRFEGHMPKWAGRNLVKRLRHPKAVWVRVPAGIAFTGGGVFSVLPGLGLWMLPVGLALLAHDVPAMQRPLARVLNFTNGKIEQRKERRTVAKEAKEARAAAIAAARAARRDAKPAPKTATNPATKTGPQPAARTAAKTRTKIARKPVRKAPAKPASKAATEA